MRFQRYFGDRSFWQNAMRLGLPIAIQNLLISSFSLIDTVMVGQLGDLPLSSVGMAGQWAWLLNMFMFGTASGTAVFLSQYWGTRDTKGIHRVTGISLLLSLGFMLPFFITALAFPASVLWLFNKTPEVISCGSQYLVIAAWSYPAIAVNAVVSNVLRSTEHVKLPMVVSSITTALNALFNWCFIFGVGPFPELGVAGAAVATVISAWAGPMLLIAISLLRKNILFAPLRSFFGFTKEQFIVFIKRATPVILNEALWGIGTLVVALIYSNYGELEYGGVTILRTCENFAFAFIQGLGAACCVMVGKAMGAGNTGQAVRDARRFAVLVPVISLFIGGLVLLLRDPLILLFNLSGNLNEVTLQTARTVMLIYGLEIAIRNIPYIQVVGIFRSGGDTFSAAIFDLVCLWFLAIPAALIASLVGAPFPLIFALTYIFEDWPKGVCCFVHFHRGKWLKPVTEEGRAGLMEWRKTHPDGKI